jgi:hypothetical protein
VCFQLSQLRAISALAAKMIHARLLPHQLSPPYESVGWLDDGVTADVGS